MLSKKKKKSWKEKIKFFRGIKRPKLWLKRARRWEEISWRFFQLNRLSFTFVDFLLSTLFRGARLFVIYWTRRGNEINLNSFFLLFKSSSHVKIPEQSVICARAGAIASLVASYFYYSHLVEWKKRVREKWKKIDGIQKEEKINTIDCYWIKTDGLCLCVEFFLALAHRWPFHSFFFASHKFIKSLSRVNQTNPHRLEFVFWARTFYFFRKIFYDWNEARFCRWSLYCCRSRTVKIKIDCRVEILKWLEMIEH